MLIGPDSLRCSWPLFATKVRPQSIRTMSAVGDENYLRAKAERKREQDRARKNKQRARERAAVVEKSVEEHLKELETIPFPYATPWRRSRPYTARLRALCAATANPRGDSFLVQIRGRELELTDGWVIELHARKKLGEKASLAAVARLHPDKSMTKRRVQSLRENMPSWKPSERPGMDFDWSVTEGGA